MSLINNMLKDLEKRKSSDRKTPYISLIKSEQKSVRLFLKNKIIYIFAILTLFFFISSLFLNKSTGILVKPLSNSQSITNLASNENSAVNQLDPITIKGVTIQIKDRITEITFLLDHPALYQLKYNQFDNQFSLLVQNADLQSELPPASLLSSGIQQLSFDKLDEGIQFNFDISPNALIKYINMIDGENNPEIVVGIESVETPSISPLASTHSQVKEPAIQTLLEQRYKTALMSAETGQLHTALQDLKAILQVDPEFNDARVSLAAMLIESEKKREARELLNEGLKLNPDYVPYIELKARLLVVEGKPDKALDLLLRTSPPVSEYPEYYGLIAAMYEKTNNNHLSAALYKKLLSYDSHHAGWWFGLGTSFEKLSEPGAAERAYSRALSEGHLPSETISFIQNRLKLLRRPGDEKT